MSRTLTRTLVFSADYPSRGMQIYYWLSKIMTTKELYYAIVTRIPRKNGCKSLSPSRDIASAAVLLHHKLIEALNLPTQ
jgi:hypothetical protein